VTEIPGLIDLQVNGYKGVDFSDPALKPKDFIRACKGMLNAGTTAFLPTMVTSPEDVYKRNLPIIAEAMALPEFQGRLLGIHIEGPFISVREGARGAHNPDWIIPPDTGLLEKMIAWSSGKIKLLTIAAEIEGADELARHAKGKGIAVALGHQTAREEDLSKLVEAGAVAITHLGNGVPAMLPRHNNTVWAALAEDRLFATVIADGNHLPPSLLKTIIRTKGPARCAVISDATSLAGFEPGQYESMGHKVILQENGRIHDPETGYMCGSSATMLECMNHLASLRILSPEELIDVAFNNPLAIIGMTPDQVKSDENLLFDDEGNVFCIKKKQ
jgi:N-acetylglucosamine-6-phosphate deacetylase